MRVGNDKESKRMRPGEKERKTEKKRVREGESERKIKRERGRENERDGAEMSR